MNCRCERPRLNRRRPEFCAACSVRLDPRIISSDENLAIFIQRIASLPGVTANALLHAQRRELAGRTEFGLSYIGRDNDAEAQEEYGDGLVYPYLSWLNDRRYGSDEIDPDLVEAAYHSALAHAAVERHRRKSRWE
jgi:hypothetical protein